MTGKNGDHVVKLLVQPGDGVVPLIKGINRAKKSVEIVIFRFDRTEIERALANAVSRGVFVHALIAYTNRGGEQHLRELEMRLLAAGVTVARTADDLVRYHGKMMIIDRRELYVLAFNYTHLDIEHSRSFGVITINTKLVHEAVKLFEADTKRQPYTPGLASFVVSPVNARKQLAAFIKGAKRQLAIYDPEISDPVMIRLLEERASAGVDIRIIGRMTRPSPVLKVRKLSLVRLHTRTMIRDDREVFIGSQSLRPLELDARREVGIIFRDLRVAGRLIKTFHDDWEFKKQPLEQIVKAELPPAVRVAKKVARAVVKELPPVAPVVQTTVREVVGENVDIDLDPEELEETVKEAVKEAVKEVISEVIEEVAEPIAAPKAKAS
jgi:phosphatidylserine/phosphatidylglycerophosphate/cardiolipin synthase-like enzyme